MEPAATPRPMAPLLPGVASAAPEKRVRKAERKGAMSQAEAERVAIVLLGELCAARRRVNPQNRRLDGKANLVELVARIRDGTSAEDLRHVIAVMEARASSDSFWAGFFDAITPFRKKNIGKHLAVTVEQAAAGAGDGRSSKRIGTTSQATEVKVYSGEDIRRAADEGRCGS